MNSLRHAILPVLLLLGSSLALGQGEAPDVSGRFDGHIALPGQQLGVIVTLVKADDGTWSGDIDIPIQSLFDVLLERVEVTGAKVRFSISGIPGDPTFTGAVSEGGRRVAGTFTQGAASFPFTLLRKTKEEQQEALAGFSEFAEKVLADLQVPGAAVAVVKNGEVLLAEGYGRRDVAQDLPVTPETLFAIGSTTKAFTGVVLATLVDEGKLAWDDRVRQHLPDFALSDDFATERMTIEDLLTHRSGLPRHDLMWYGTPFDRAELVRRLRYLEPSADLRTRFQYQNLMFMTAGYLAGQVAGTTWEELVRERIFGPLGMARSNLSAVEWRQDPDRALPYAEGAEVPFKVIDTVGPAGSINSSASDMAKWLEFQLGNGEVGGKRVVSKERLAETHRPRIVMREPSGAEYGRVLYSFGWMVSTYRGHPVLEHGGGIDGFTALVAVFPEDGIGVAVLTNAGGTAAAGVLARDLYDRLLGLDPIDRLAKATAGAAQAKALAKQSESLRELDRKKDTLPSRPLADYAGEFEHPAYGLIEVTAEGEKLKSRYFDYTGNLVHWHYDVFELDHPKAKIKLNFLSNAAGDIDHLEIQLESAVDPIVFNRKPLVLDEAALSKFTGKYQMAGIVLTVAQQAGKLTLTVPGQPTYTLSPTKPGEFKLVELDGYRIRFVSEAGQVVRAIAIQPNGIFAAERIQ